MLELHYKCIYLFRISLFIYCLFQNRYIKIINNGSMLVGLEYGTLLGTCYVVLRQE